MPDFWLICTNSIQFRKTPHPISALDCGLSCITFGNVLVHVERDRENLFAKIIKQWRAHEQCSQDRPPGSTTFSCQAITAGAALAAHSTQNRVQGRCVDLQKTQQRHSTDIPHSSHQGSRQWTDTSLLYCTTTGQVVHQNGLCDSSLSLLCTDRLELVPRNNNALRDSLYVLI